MTVLAIIPARKNSKRLPGKNLRQFCGKPLIQWTIEQAKRIKEIDRWIVTTDYNAELLNPPFPLDMFDDVSQQYHDRPKHLCGPNVHMAQVIMGVLAAQNDLPDLVVLLQPTSPTRRDSLIVKAIERAKANTHRQSAVSIDRTTREPNGAVYVFPPHRLPPLDDYVPILSHYTDINFAEDFDRAEAVMKKRLA